MKRDLSEYLDKIDLETKRAEELAESIGDEAYKDGYENGYNKAVDEFAKRLKKIYPIMENDFFTINDTLHREIDKIAQKMKGGAE